MTSTAPTGTHPGPALGGPSSSSSRDSLHAVARQRAREKGSLWGLYGLVVALVVFQRFVVPGTRISACLPLVFLVLIVLVLRGHLVADVRRTILYAAAVALCTLSSLLVSAWSIRTISVESLGLLAVVYIPTCTRLSPALRRHYPDVLRLFLSLMTVAGAICVGQWVAQQIGWQFEDLLSFLPSQLLVTASDFNLSYPIYYGSDIYKSNGIVFLEASFASQFLALGIIAQILLGGSRWRIALMGAGLLATFSGTGLILLGCGLVVLAVRRGGRWAAKTAAVVVIAIAAIGLSPAGVLMADRSGEASVQGSSGNARFVAPYEQVGSAILTDFEASLIGRGPGSVDRDQEFFNPYGVFANYPAIPKLLGEYGLPASTVFIAFLLTLMLYRVPSITLGLMGCLLLFVLSGALLQPPVIYLCWLLTGMFAAPHQPSTAVWRTGNAGTSRSDEGVSDGEDAGGRRRGNDR